MIDCIVRVLPFKTMTIIMLPGWDDSFSFQDLAVRFIALDDESKFYFNKFVSGKIRFIILQDLLE